MEVPGFPVQCTAEDLRAYAAYLEEQGLESGSWGQLLARWLTTYGVVILMEIVGWPKEVGLDFWRKIVRLVMIFVGTFLVALIFRWWYRRKAWVVEKDQAAMLPAVYQVVADGVVWQTEAGRELYPWLEIERLIPTETHLFLILTRRRVKVLPKRCFKDRAAVNALGDAILRPLIRRASVVPAKT